MRYESNCASNNKEPKQTTDVSPEIRDAETGVPTTESTERLVVATASSALFDLSEANAVFEAEGLDRYRRFQRENEETLLRPGPAFAFIRRLLNLAKLPEFHDSIDVVLISRNDPDSGLRILNSIEHFGLAIKRAVFVNGKQPYRYLKAFDASIFLSTDENDVREAINEHYPAGRVLASGSPDNEDPELRIAFDFDGIVVDDEAERIFHQRGVRAFLKNEREYAETKLQPGPLHKLFTNVARIQTLDRRRRKKSGETAQLIRTALITSRSLHTHKRVVLTLRALGIEIDETFFLAGLDKCRILQQFRPHLFFDDRLPNDLSSILGHVVHVPFGVVNESSTPSANH